MSNAAILVAFIRFLLAYIQRILRVKNNRQLTMPKTKKTEDCAALQQPENAARNEIQFLDRMIYCYVEGGCMNGK